MNARAEFLRRLRTVVDLVADDLSEEQRTTITRLIDNNEGGEAMVTLAWVISEDEIAVLPSTRQEMWSLAEGLVSPGDFPPDFCAPSSE